MLILCTLVILAPPLILGCPLGWTKNPESGYCYQVLETQPSWYLAKDICKSNVNNHGGTGGLAKIDSAQENEFVKGFLKSRSEIGFWMGANDISREGSWVWEDGTSVTFIDWHRTEPNDYNGDEDCAAWFKLSYSSELKWADANCIGHKLAAVCQMRESSANGWIRNPTSGIYYKILTEQTNWNDGKEKCTELTNGNGGLAKISSPQENEFVKGLIKNYNNIGFWMGANDISKEDSWVWTDGKPVTFFDWHRTEPNNYNGVEHCVAWFKLDYSNEMKWADANCDGHFLGSVCQKTANSQLEPCRCGLAQRKNRIIGGEETEPHEYPWMVRLQIRYPSRNIGLCGGSLITNEWILTAAHCVDNNPLIEVYLGDHDIRKGDKNEKKLAVLKVVKHPNYKYPNFDFALVQIKSVNFESHSNIRPICLPSARRGTYPSFNGYTGIATGWGDTDPKYQSEKLSDVLKEVLLQIMSNDDCKFNTLWYPGIITDAMLCARVPSGDKDTCLGDSGGPLITSRSGKPNYEIVGITSFGPDPCAIANKPGVYARVSAAMPWIKEITAGSQSCRR